MPIDSRIALMVNPPKPLDVIGPAMASSRLRNEQLARQAQQMEMAAAERAASKEKAVQEAIGRQGGDIEKALPEITQADPKTGLELRKILSGLKDSELSQAEKQLKMSGETITRRAQLMAEVKDEPSYQQALSVIAQEDPEAAKKMPSRFNPEYVAFQVNRGKTLAQRATEAHQAATLEMERRGQDITAHGQMLTAETALENRKAADARSEAERTAADTRAADTRKASDERARLDRESRERIASRQRTPDERTTDQKNYDQAKRDGYKGTFLEYMRERNPRAATGAERKAINFYNRGKEAVEAITTPGPDGKTLEQKMAGQTIVGQGQLRYAPNVLQTDEQQRYRQAQRAFTEARLRKESGAAVPPHEYEADAKTYFAQPGDSELVIEQKRQGRETILRGIAFEAGRAYEEYFGEPAPKAPTTPPATGGRIRVRRKSDGTTGTLDAKDFDPAKYDRL